MIPTSDEIKAMWKMMADLYARKIEKNNLPLAISLSSMLQLCEEKPSKILEVGSGSGSLSRYLAQNLDYECNITAVDISDEMITIAKSLFTKYPILPNVKVSYEVANSEELTNIPDESIDAYLSALCLHLTSDPKKMLQELKRVLKKGKRFGLSVAGPEENVTFASTLSSVFKELEEEIPKLKSPKIMRSPFYLGKKEDLIKLVEEAGLEVDYCWVQSGPLNILTFEDYESLVLKSPGLVKMMETLTEEEHKKFMEAIKKRLYDKFIDIKNPLVVEAVQLIGKKP